jgi:glycosyltransferase involved in cell wall biosynthesis
MKDVRSQTAAVISAFNEEKHISDIVRRTRAQLPCVVVVDDGSTDHTAQRAREAGAEVIVHDRNRGKGEALKTGLGYCLEKKFAYVVLLDADGQHLPEEIERFLNAAASAMRPCFFIGNRMNNVEAMPFIRRVVNRCMSAQISRLCRQKIPDTQCGFRMLDRRLIPHLLAPESVRRFDYDTETLLIASRQGYRLESVPITTVYSDEVSKIHPVRDAIRFFKLIWRYRKTERTRTDKT